RRPFSGSHSKKSARVRRRSTTAHGRTGAAGRASRSRPAKPRNARRQTMPTNPVVTGFFHEPTFSIAYLVACPETNRAAIIDPVLDYDEKSGRVSHKAADAMLAEIERRNLKIDWILDTHPHADHFSAAVYLK